MRRAESYDGLFIAARRGRETDGGRERCINSFYKVLTREGGPMRCEGFPFLKIQDSSLEATISAEKIYLTGR